MDVFTALQTAVSGLKAQAFSLENISGNIANSQTTGYKRVDTNFVDLVAEQAPNRQVAGSVAANSRLTTTIQGSINATEVPTNIAINGPGFFVVQTKTGDANNQTTFSSGNVYTRRGDFAPDKDGYLRNGGGAYLTGTSLDPVTGRATSEGPIQISTSTLPAKATSTINYAANLPKTPATKNYSSTVAGSELLPATGFATDPRITTGTGTATVAPGDASKLLANSINGPSLTAYTASGAPVTINTVWAKVANGDASATPATNDVWNLFYQNNNAVDSSASTWTNAGTAFAFNSSGQLVTPTTTSVSIPNLTVNGIDLGAISVAYGAGGLTAYTATAATTRTLTQDGYSAGQLNSVSINAEGEVVGSYSNGNSVALAKVAVVQFTNPDGLKADSAGNYRQTLESGSPRVGLNGATIEGSNVEQSNTDIASEFSKMIVTQQAYSANTKVISTAQDMMSSLINIIR
ncbi:flagellar hook-basal body complex protein [Methylobacterium sp. 77]|uniref:flagellar hook protein FlgE n=1 Tax=Methylobacterium sp. 77 TaxID=1101192 RepID=UPI000375A3C9|nr:flagellar hook-basal body complex protein [Methylobacterium sp. 77]